MFGRLRKEKFRMKRLCKTLVAVMLMSTAVSVIAGGQSSSRRRPPVLTNDDLSAASVPSERVSEPLERAKPAERTTRETSRGPIQWHRDLRRALESANADGKLVVVDVYTDWCGWCKKMDQNIYSTSLVAGLSREQVFVKLNAEDGGQGQSFAAQMGVTGFPTTIVLDARGQVLKVARGYIASPRAFIELVETARETRSQ
jgi:thiol:disulfide interchange protein